MVRILILGMGAATLAMGGVSTAQQQGAAASVPQKTAVALQPKAVTRSEFMSKLDQGFATIDTNHDGSLSESEVAVASAHELQQVQAALRARTEAQFKALDTNKDGQLNLAEFLAVTPQVKPNGTPADELRKYDTNHDGKVSAEEFKAPRISAFNKIDTNHDGVLSVQEQAAARQGK